MATYVIDIDGTLCLSNLGQYDEAIPYMTRIELINALHSAGNRVVLFTARGMGRFRGVKLFAYARFYISTYKQLKRWGVKFDKLILGKPSADFYVDDKAVSAEKFFASVDTK